MTNSSGKPINSVVIDDNGDSMIEAAAFIITISSILGQFIQEWCRGESIRIGWHVSQSQVRALRRLYAHPRSPLGSVADTLGIKGPTASNILSRLGELGMVEKERDPQNKQRVLMSLTEQGMAFVENYDRDLLAEVSTRINRLKPVEVKNLLSAAQGFTRAYAGGEEDYVDPKLSVSKSRMAGIAACSQALCDFLSANAYRYISDALSGSRVSNLQLRILVYIDRHSESTMTELANYIGVRVATVSTAVHVLVKHGMARSERVRGKGQRRQVSATGLGRKVIIGYKMELVQGIYLAIASGLSDEELTATLHAREVLLNALEDSAPVREDIVNFVAMAESLSRPFQ
ncbi:MAG: MarR family transcriptional regulator [Gammaproteobacteria bacterium]|nr:MarR family transcriptional regulator [Gammaproteobacteria bacterium]